MFRTVPLFIIRSFSRCIQQWYISYRFADSLRASCQQTCMYCCMYSEKTPDDGQRNCPKHVKFYCKSKFEKLVHLVGFIIRMCWRYLTKRKKTIRVNESGNNRIDINELCIIYLFSRLYDVSTSSCAHLTIILSSSSICLCHSSLLPLIPFPPSVL